MADSTLRVLIDAINDNERPRGPDRYLLELLPRMLAADPGLAIRLAHAPWQRAFAAADFGPRVTPVCLAPPRRPAARLVWQATGFVRFANRSDADVVFLPNLIWTPGLRKPSVVTAHDLLHFRAPEKFGMRKALALRRVIGLALRRARKVIAVSRFTAADVTRFAGVPATRIATIFEGGPEARPRRAAGPGDFFLFVGKIERTKGIADLIAAFSGSAVLARLGMRLVIVGPDGNAAADVSAALARGAARIERPGYVEDDALRGLFATARGFVFPSRAEGFGLVVLEAMSAGAPVIAARATSLPEVIGDAGLLVEPGDVAGLRAAMENLAQDTVLFEKLQAAGYARLDAFSWSRAGRETVAVLRSVTA